MASIAKILTLHCDGAAELASLEHDRQLTTVESVALKVHTTICAPCRHYRRQLGIVHNALMSELDQEDNDPALPQLPEAKREAIRSQIQEELRHD